MAVSILVLSLIGASCGDSGGEKVTWPFSTAGVNEFQARILDDGLVTQAEYEQSLFATADCIRSKGFETKPIFVHGAGSLLITVGEDTPANQEAVDETSDSCSKEYLDFIDSA